jgi:hypothetical protein
MSISKREAQGNKALGFFFFFGGGWDGLAVRLMLDAVAGNAEFLTVK